METSVELQPLAKLLAAIVSKESPHLVILGRQAIAGAGMRDLVSELVACVDDARRGWRGAT